MRASSVDRLSPVLQQMAPFGKRALERPGRALDGAGGRLYGGAGIRTRGAPRRRTAAAVSPRLASGSR
jgi:hypothetical protein